MAALELPKTSDLPALVAALRSDVDSLLAQLAALEATIAENSAELRRLKASFNQARQFWNGR